MQALCWCRGPLARDSSVACVCVCWLQRPWCVAWRVGKAERQLAAVGLKLTNDSCLNTAGTLMCILSVPLAVKLGVQAARACEGLFHDTSGAHAGTHFTWSCWSLIVRLLLFGGLKLAGKPRLPATASAYCSRPTNKQSTPSHLYMELCPTQCTPLPVCLLLCRQATFASYSASSLQQTYQQAIHT
jgi:hypothetical protein